MIGDNADLFLVQLQNMVSTLAAQRPMLHGQYSVSQGRNQLNLVLTGSFAGRRHPRDAGLGQRDADGLRGFRRK